MDANFGDTNYKYNVVLESAATRDFGEATIYCQNGTNYAQLGYGINRIYPTATYLVYRLSVLPNNSWNYLSNAGGRGTGLTAAQADQITYVVFDVDGNTACDCSRTYDISEKLKNVIDKRWNVVCQSTPNIYSEVAIANNEWIHYIPAKCTYFIYTV